MGVGTDEETTGESIVLENDLVDNTRARAPETKVVLGAGRGQEVVNFLVDADGAGKILLTTNLGLNQVVTVDGGGVGDGIHTSRHELEDGHLSSGVLAGNAVGAELEVRLATLDFLAVGIIQMGVEDLLGVGKGSVKTRSNDGEVLGHLLVVDEVAFFPDVLANLYCATLVSMALVSRLMFTCKWTKTIKQRQHCPAVAKNPSGDRKHHSKEETNLLV